MKKLVLLGILMFSYAVLFPQDVLAFTDINESYQKEEILELAQKKIISGYEDGSFKPQAKITRAEVATIFARANKLNMKGISDADYLDVKDHWASKYIASVSKVGIMNGMGDGMFHPDEKVTLQQIQKMMIAMIGKDDEAKAAGGWFTGYEKVLKEMNFRIERKDESKLEATREEVAGIVSFSLKNKKPTELVLGGIGIELGENISELRKPDEILEVSDNMQWYIYGTKDYTGFHALAIDDNEVVGFASAGLGFEYLGNKAGQPKVNSKGMNEHCNILLDKNDGNKVHGIYCIDYDRIENHRKDAFNGEGEISSKMVFHYVNGFRVLHGLKPLTWSDKAAKSAWLHSKDMKDRKYFEHVNPEGELPWDRMKKQGLTGAMAENIFMGSFAANEAYDAWINSKGHRTNILGNFEYIGIGTYGEYMTQNFH